MKKRLYFLLAAAILLGSATLAGTEKNPESGQPRIFDPRIIINLAERTLTVSFRYEEVAGSIDDARMMVFLETISAAGEINLSPIPIKAAEPRGNKDDELTPSVITQGLAKYSADLPDTLEIGAPEEVFGAGIAVIDCRGRKALPVFIRKMPEEPTRPESFAI